MSPGGVFYMPSTWLSHSSPPSVQPHKPAMQHQTCHRGRAVERCTLHDPWTPPTRDIRDRLPSTDHDCWWKETPGRGAFCAYSAYHSAFCLTRQNNVCDEVWRIDYNLFCLSFIFPQGSVFFSFPDGTGMLYSLQGTAEPPKAEDTIVHHLPAKTHHTQLLPVHNWLSKPQR